MFIHMCVSFPLKYVGSSIPTTLHLLEYYPLYSAFRRCKKREEVQEQEREGKMCNKRIVRVIVQGPCMFV